MCVVGCLSGWIGLDGDIKFKWVFDVIHKIRFYSIRCIAVSVKRCKVFFYVYRQKSTKI